MLKLHQERIGRGLAHKGGRPYWGNQRLPLKLRLLRPLVYGLKDIQRRLNGQAPYQPPRPWTMGAFTVIHNEKNQVLWVRRRDRDLWNLPGGRSERLESPWQTALRETREETGLQARLTGLSGVYLKPQNHIVFTFTAETVGGRLTLNSEAAGFGYFAVGSEPANILVKQVQRAADATRPGETRFRVQE